jgi:hypothetical protein
MSNTLIAVLQLEFERGRVPAKGRAFFNDKKALGELYQCHHSHLKSKL